MKILLTGNMGYVGPVVVETLHELLPDSVLWGFDAGFFAGCLFEPSPFPERRLERQLFGDVRRVPPEALDGVDAIVHLAAVSNDPMGKAFENVTAEINGEATVGLARAARERGVGRFVFASSCSIYGSGGAEARTEESPLDPLTAYARSKVRAENGLRELAGPGFVVTSLRFATACGMSPRLRLDLVLNDFVASAVTSGVIRILSDGTPWRPLIHVGDMGRAIAWAVRREGKAGGEFLALNAGSSEWNYQILDLARAVQRSLPGVTLDVNPNPAPDRRSYRVNFSLFARLAPAHQPKAKLDAVVQELAGGLARARFSDAAFRSSRWIRLRVLEELRDTGRVSPELFWI